MVKEIVRDTFFLSQKSKLATQEDIQIIQDLKDTLEANKERCVGMAANMIGYQKCILVFYDQNTLSIMINPEIIKCSQMYEPEEGCLSLEGTRKTKRYQSIKVKYLDENFKIKIKTYKGFTAQIIQHEMDHFEGILI